MLRENKLDQLFVKLHRIIPFSNVEGMGNRCSVFLQGCNINCLYCHNPETIQMNDKDAKVVSLQYILDQIKQSMPFIRGVTISGGEPTLHYKVLVPLFQEIHRIGLTCYLDSNGFFDFEQIKELIDETDKFLFDIKGLGNGLDRLCFDLKNKQGIQTEYPLKKHKLMDKNIENLKKLLPLNKVEEVRLVHIESFYDPYAVVAEIAEAIRDYPEVALKLIRVHAKGSRSEETISKFSPSVESHQKLCDFAKEIGIRKIICIQ